MSGERPFHLALPTQDLQGTEQFYTEILGCSTGRRDKDWIDFNFFGHQIVFHDCGIPPLGLAKNFVDEKEVQIPHFGVILTLEQWKALAQDLENKKILFIISPYIRFEGTPGEQATMFFLDPNGYALEFKAFASDESIFQPFS
ncbi:MAG: glyoxalase [Waddliaceae bacterium]|nr:glyoxalase [Waddliaceae bacterium]